MHLSGRSLPGAGECAREKATPLVYDLIAENVSHVLIIDMGENKVKSYFVCLAQNPTS